MNQLVPIENNGKRILLTSQLAELYETTDRRISENFNANKGRYTEGEDYFLLQGEKLKEFLQSVNSVVQNQAKIRALYLWTEHGALLHAKSLGTDKAWEIYGELVDTYFRVQEQKKLSAMDMIKLQLAAMEELDERVDTLEEKVEKQITLDCGKQRTLQKSISSRAYECNNYKRNRCKGLLVHSKFDCIMYACYQKRHRRA